MTALVPTHTALLAHAAVLSDPVHPVGGCDIWRQAQRYAVALVCEASQRVWFRAQLAARSVSQLFSAERFVRFAISTPASANRNARQSAW